MTLTIIVLAGVAQDLVTRVGVRRVLPVGLALATAALVLLGAAAGGRQVLLRHLPGLPDRRDRPGVHLHPADDRGPDGRPGADAGVASGLFNTTQQIGGAIGLAAATTIAITFTGNYVDSHPGASAVSAPALTYGFQITFYVLAGVAALAAVLAAVLIAPQADAEVVELELTPVEEAA